MKIALVACGLEHIQRGFESFTRELFDNYKEADTEVHLYKGSGKKIPNEIVITPLRRSSLLLKLLKPTSKGIYYRYKIECFTFAFMMLPHLIKHKYDLILFSDNELGKALLILRRIFKLRCKILFSNGAPWHAGECKIYDGVQEVTKAMQEKNIADGVDKSRSWFVPYGIAVRNYNFSQLNKESLKQHFNVPAGATVILSLSALKFSHKRLDWLIKEYAQLKGNYFLIMAGGEDEETPGVKKLAGQMLQAGSYSFMTVPYSEVVKLLAIADVMVSTSLSEAFGRVLLEATVAKVPVLAHPHYAAKEIIAHTASYVNMEKEGELAGMMVAINKDADLRNEIIEKNYSYSIEHFDWSNVNQQYKAMYEGVLKSSVNES
jgi:glycosyltransferase involved in cell wall biosynthesis